jgi:FtsZ-binding cell division protein ZapB
MASFSNLYDEIEYKIKKATIRINEYQLEIEKLQRENKQLKEGFATCRDELILMQEKHDLLAITKILLQKEDRKRAQKRINDLVREIDNCVMLLKK